METEILLRDPVIEDSAERGALDGDGGEGGRCEEDVDILLSSHGEVE